MTIAVARVSGLKKKAAAKFKSFSLAERNWNRCWEKLHHFNFNFNLNRHSGGAMCAAFEFIKRKQVMSIISHSRLFPSPAAKAQIIYAVFFVSYQKVFIKLIVWKNLKKSFHFQCGGGWFFVWYPQSRADIYGVYSVRSVIISYCGECRVQTINWWPIDQTKSNSIKPAQVGHTLWSDVSPDKKAGN